MGLVGLGLGRVSSVSIRVKIIVRVRSVVWVMGKMSRRGNV